MNYDLSLKELGFLCVIFKQTLPFIEGDPFETITKSELQEEWRLFCRDFIERGWAKFDTNENLVLDNTLSETMMCCFRANIVVSIIQDEWIDCVFYKNSEHTTLVSRNDSLFTLQFIDSEDAFMAELLNKLDNTINRAIDPTEQFSMEMSTEKFEQILEWYNKKQAAKISGFCENKLVDFKICMSILETVHDTNCKTVLTERVDKPGTIITRIWQHDGINRLARSIYSENGDFSLIAQCINSQLPSVITDFEGG